jgi:hypothetical protein
MVDAFPAFEAYAKVGEVTRAFFNAPPPEGNTVVDLAKWPWPWRPFKQTLEFR